MRLHLYDDQGDEHVQNAAVYLAKYTGVNGRQLAHAERHAELVSGLGTARASLHLRVESVYQQHAQLKSRPDPRVPPYSTRDGRSSWTVYSDHASRTLDDLVIVSTVAGKG